MLMVKRSGCNHVTLYVILEISLSHGRSPGQSHTSYKNFLFFFTNLSAQFTDYLSCGINPVTVSTNHFICQQNFPHGVYPVGSKSAQKLILSAFWTISRTRYSQGSELVVSNSMWVCLLQNNREILSVSLCPMSWKGLGRTELHCKFQAFQNT